jgi:hypothetical protein
MAFDLEQFKQVAIQSGYSEVDINKYLQKKAETNKDANFALEAERANKTAIGRFLESGVIPGAFATAGSIGGGLLGTIPGAFAGGFGGYGAGKAVQDLALRATGIRQTTPEVQNQNLADMTKGALATGGTNAATLALLKSLNFLRSPVVNTGKALESARAGTTAAPETAENIMTNVKNSNVYKYAPQETQQSINDATSRLISRVNPTLEVGGGQVPINEYYQGLNAMQPTTGATEYNVLNQATRGVINPQQNLQAKFLSKAYGTGANLNNNYYLKRGLVNLPLYYLGTRLLATLGNLATNLGSQ